MPYKPTGRPPGRPRKKPLLALGKTLKRAHTGSRRALPSPNANLHQPPRFGKRRKRAVARRAILHPNVIAQV